MLREKLYADGDLSKCYLVEMRQDCHICKVTFRHNLIVRADGVGSFRPAAVNEADLNFSVIPKPDERWNLKGKRSASSTTEKADGEEPLKDVEMEEGEIEARPMNMN